MKKKYHLPKISIGTLWFTLLLGICVNGAKAQTWTSVGGSGFSAGMATWNSLVIAGGGTPYIAYTDNANGNKATVMKFDGTSWVTVGSVGFSAGGAPFISLAIDGGGTPYVVYQDNANSNKATVMKFNGSSWTTVGIVGFSAGTANYTSIAIDGSGTPYVAYQDDANSSKATVMKYNGSGWVTVGVAGFSANTATYTSLVINDTGIPYVAYRDFANSNKATVMKYNGSSWVAVGSAGFSAGQADFTRLAMDSSGTPYVAYKDWSNSNKATVMKYNGSSWVTVGSAGFSAASVDHVYLAIDGSGTIYVTYVDWGSGGKATVMKYNGSGWLTVGSTGFSAGQSEYTRVAVDGSGTPYVAYTDYANSYKATVMKFGTPPPPSITSVSPLAANPGSSVTITGTNFNTTAANNIVYFGATKATVNTASATSLAVTVPVGATYMPVSVNNSASALTGYSQYPFLPTFNNSAYIGGMVNFDAKVDFATGSTAHPEGLVIADIDADGKADMICANNGSSSITVYRNVSTSGSISSGSFASGVDLTVGTQPRYLAVADLDGDGKLDIIVPNSSTNTISIFRNLSSPGSLSGASFASRVDLSTTSGPICVVVADIDADGKPDIAAGNGGTVSIFRNISSVGSITTSSFATKVDISTSPSIVFAAGDIDGDGKPELVMPNYLSTGLTIYRNVSSPGSITTGSFASGVTFGTGGSPWGVSLVDIDLDGKLDVVTANSGTGVNTISILRNTSAVGSINSGSIAAKVDFATGNSPYGLSVGDFDGDGKPDISVASNGSNRVSVFRNTSSVGAFTAGTLAAKVDFTVTGPVSVAAGDLDGDGKADLAVAAFGGNVLSVLKNTPLSPITGSLVVCQGATTTLADVAASGSWATSDTAVATVGSSSGIVTGVTTGTATVTYTVAGGSTTTIVTVSSIPAVSAISGASSVCIGATITLADTTAGGSWTSNAPSLATVSSSGVVTCIASGSLNISYTVTNSCGATNSIKSIIVNGPPADSGLVSAFAGTGTAGYSGDGGSASSATLRVASDVTLDASGNIYIADENNRRVRKINTSGIITTVAGNGGITYSGDGVSALSTSITVTGVVVDDSGNIFIADEGNNRVRKVNPSGIISTVAGNGTAGYSGDGGTATAAMLNNPRRLALDGAHNLYISDKGNNVIRKVTPGGNISTIAGTGVAGYNGDGISAITARLYDPYGISVDDSGNVFVAEISNHRVRKINTSGIITTVAGTGTSGYNGDGTATTRQLSYPWDVTTDHAGNIFVADAGNYMVRKINVAGNLSTLAGTGTAGNSGDGGIALAATFNHPAGIALDTAGNILIADYSNNKIRRISAGLSPITGTATLCIGAVVTLSNNTSGGSWSTANPSIATVNSSGVVTGVAQGTATISYFISGSCGSSSVIKTVTVNGLPSVSAITGASSVCVGATITLNDTTSGGSWSSSMPSIASVNSSGLVSGGIAGTVTISYTAFNSCGSTSVTKVMTVNPLPNAGTITGVTNVNVGSTITLTNGVSGGTWSAGNSNATISAAGVVTGISAGSVLISYTATNSCGSAVDTMLVTVISSITPITGILTICDGNSTTLGNASSGGSWFSSDTTVAPIGVGSGIATGVSAGTAIISYVYSGGMATAVITVNPLPGAITGGLVVCAGNTTALSSTTIGGTWSSSATAFATINSSGVATGINAGTATISYILSTGCATSSVITVNATPSVSGSLSVCVGNSSSLTGSISGGTWASSNAAIASVDAAGLVSGLTSGTSNITYTLPTGCRATKVITVSAAPTLGAISGPSTVTAGSTITLTNSISGGTWSTSSGNATISASGVVTGVAAGTTIVSYVKSNSCGTATATAIVTVNGAPITGTAVVCAGSSTSLSHIVSGGTWSSGNTAIATVGSTTGVVTGVSAGTADITYTYSTGSAIRTVTVNAAPSVGSITGTTSICSGATSTLGNSTSGGSWTSSTTSVASVVSSTGVVTGLAAGTARITYTVSNSCGTANAITTVTVTTSPSAGTITGTATLCVGGTTTLSSSGSGGLWSSGNTAVATIGSSINIVNGISAGTATISYVVTNSCGTSAATRIVTVNGSPSAGSITGTATVCIGSTRTLSATVSGGVWLSGDVSLATVGSSNGIVAGVSAGIVTISYGVSGSCGTTFATRAVTVNAAPGVSPISGTLTLCATGTTTLSDATSGGTWTSGATGIATVNSTTGVVTGVTVGTATISYTANTTCGTAIATAVVTVSTMSGGVISGSATICAGATTTFGHPVSGGSWSSSNTAIASVDVTSGIVSGIAVGSATISYTTVGACGTAIATKGITVNTVPSPGTITGSASTCVGSSVTLSDAVTGGVWLSADASVATISSSSGVLSGISGGAVAISYAVSNSCGTSFAIRIETVNLAPSVGTISGPSTACTGTTITLMNTTSGGTWSSGNTSVATIGATNGVVSAITTGTTSITYTISGTCGSANAIVVLTVNLSPSAGTITGAGPVCTGSALTLSDAVSGGSWSSADPSVATINATSGILAGVTPGAVTISYTVTNGCGTAIATTVVTVNAGPVAGTISGGTNICPSSTTTLSSTAVGGVWSSGNASVAAVGSADGIVSGVSNGVATISYAVTNSCGTAVASVVVTVSASPSAGVITGVSSACAGSLVTLSNSVSGGTWSSSATAVATINSAGVLNAIAAGTTIISYTVITSCGTAVATSVFTVNALPDAGSVTGLSSVSVGAAITLSDVATGGVWSMSNGNATISAGGVVTGVALGNDTAYYTVTNGCGTDIASKVIVVGYTVDPITGTLTVCLGSTTALNDATSGGAWSSSAPAIASVTSTGLVTGVATGTAVISYTSMGVSATAVVTVLAAPSAITGTMIMCEGTVTTLHNSFSGTWFSDNVAVATVGSTTGYVNGLTAGTAGITFTMASGCTASVIVTVNGLPAAITGSASACIGNTTTLSDADAGGTWSSSNVGVAAVGSATGIVTGVNTGTARITYTLPTSCRTITVATVNAPPAAITGTMTMCEGATTVLSTTTTGGAWSSSNASVASVSATGIVTGVTAGTADITYTTGAGCTRSATVTVNVTPGSTTGVHSVCIGLTTTLSNATPGGTWASSTGSVATINTSGIVTGITAGTSRITYAVGSCKTTSVVSVNALPGTISGIKKACVGLTTTLSATPAGGTWSASNIFIASIGATSGIVTGNSAGTTDVTYTSSAGCYRATTVTINPVPATITGTTLVCVGSSTALSSSTTGGLSWTTSASAIASVSSTGLVTGNATGVASITYTLGTGCYTSTDVTVTPLPSTITGTKIVCVGAVTSLGDAISGGTWSSGSVANATVDPSTGVVTGVAYGTSSITYSISTGCFQKTTVSVNPQPGAISGYSITCIGTSTELSSTYGGTWISGNTGIATVGASTGIVTGVSGGTVDITYALTSTGCYRTQTVTVNAALPASTGTFSVCPGLTTTLSNSIAGGSWVSPNSAIATVGSLSGIVTGVGAGTIGISYTFGTGCRAVTIVTVKPLPAIISGPASMCNTMTANLTDVTPGGTWSSSDLSVATVGIANGVVYGVAGGTAYITYTAPNTCYTSTVMTVIACVRPGNPNTSPELLNARLYPNPTSGVFTIETGHSGTLVLFTLDGKQLERYEVKAGITELSIPHGLAAGVYMCRFNADDGETLMVRLIYEP